MEFVAPKRLVRRIFIHCSASDNPSHDDISVIKKWHLERDFKDVGYHYFIKANGEIQRGRNIEVAPAAQERNNAKTIAICLHGLKVFTKEQFDALVGLASQIHKAIPMATFHGHCEVNKNKTCPVFDYRKILKLDKNGKMI